MPDPSASLVLIGEFMNSQQYKRVLASLLAAILAFFGANFVAPIQIERDLSKYNSQAVEWRDCPNLFRHSRFSTPETAPKPRQDLVTNPKAHLDSTQESFANWG
jgi:hypothetical protein